MAEWITIASDALTAAINPHGAELSSLRDRDGHELMTDADPAFWTGRAPVLFPIVGAVNDEVIRVDGRAYAMKRHGFARHSDFALVDQASDRVTLRLADSEATRAVYPFGFELDLSFTVNGAALAIMATVSNPGETPLPAQLGFHPGFAWPLPYHADRADHAITFAADEPGALSALTSDGLIAPERRASPLHGRTLALDDALFANDALIWNPVASQGVTYGPATGPKLRIDFPDTPQLGIWTKPGARFVCIEPWHGHADPVGYTGEFRDKPGIFTVEPGMAKHIAMSVTLVR